MIHDTASNRRALRRRWTSRDSVLLTGRQCIGLPWCLWAQGIRVRFWRGGPSNSRQVYELQQARNLSNADSARRRQEITIRGPLGGGIGMGARQTTARGASRGQAWVPAPAVTPTLRAYIQVAAVKTLLVELRAGPGGRRRKARVLRRLVLVAGPCLSGCAPCRRYLEQTGVFKAGASLNNRAWNNRIGRSVWLCWLSDRGNDEQEQSGAFVFRG